jgi:predicted RecA/RadA family phage recombinase
MATNKVQDNGVKEWTNAGSAVSSGGVVVAGNMIGIALVDIANGASGSVDFTPGRVFSGVPKVTAAVFVVGEKLIWDTSAGTRRELTFAAERQIPVFYRADHLLEHLGVGARAARPFGAPPRG